MLFFRTEFRVGIRPLLHWGTAGAFVAIVYGGLVTVYFQKILYLDNTYHDHYCNKVGAWTSQVMEKYWGEDPRTIVINEFIGVWIPALVAPCGDKIWILALLGFALFRVIDIFKPLGCRWIDQNLKGGWGVMLDDALAGFYVLVIAYVVKIVLI